jgi:conjugal transfer pilus assembly protein TraV
MSKLKWAVGAAALTALAGCATFGGNVKGNFRCEAPGGMCAPTSKIDDQALALISGDQGQGVDRHTPAAGFKGLSASASTSALAPHSPRALKIILPARQDRFGRWREPTIVYAELDEEGPVLLTGGDRPSASPAKLSLADLAAGAPELPTLADAAPPQSARPSSREEIADAVKQRLQAGKGAPSPATSQPADKPVAAASPSVSAPSFPASDAAARGN